MWITGHRRFAIPLEDILSKYSCANETVIFQVLQKKSEEFCPAPLSKIETDYIKGQKKQILCGGMEALHLIFMFWNQNISV